MKPYLADPDFTLYQGDVLATLRELPAASVHTCVTSPPYWGLRDYGVDGQIGLEQTPEEFVAAMTEVFREVRRVLRSDGTCWINIGDSYANAPGGDPRSGFNSRYKGKEFAGQKQSEAAGEFPAGMDRRAPGLKQKDLVGIPWMLAFALRADGWYLRADIIWSKPNPMPESVTDRPTKAHEYVFLLTKSPRYYFDAEAIKEAAVEGTDLGKRAGGDDTDPSGKRNKRSVWEIPTAPYADAHFATFPQALVEPCILAGTSEYGCCAECGAPWERKTEIEYEAKGRTTNGPRSLAQRHETAGFAQRLEKVVTTTGWKPTCDCLIPCAVGCQETNECCDKVTRAKRGPEPCVVLDPFMGSGTTAYVARRIGRRSVGIDLNPDYCELAAKRLAQQSLFASKEAA